MWASKLRFTSTNQSSVEDVREVGGGVSIGGDGYHGNFMEGPLTTANLCVGREAFDTLIVAYNQDTSKGRLNISGTLLHRVSIIGGSTVRHGGERA